MSRTVPEDATPLLTQAAREVVRQFAGFVTLDDLQQEAFLWALANPKKVKEYLEDEDQKQGSRMLYAGVRNRLRWYATRQKAQASGYSPADLAYYSVDQIEKELLPAVFDPEQWANPPKGEQDEVRSRRDPAHGGGWMAMLADVADAMGKLPARSRDMLRFKYGLGYRQVELASIFEIAESSVSEALDRAVREIQHQLGGDRPEYEEDEIRIGSRRVVPNTTAQAITGSEYDGG